MIKQLDTPKIKGNFYCCDICGNPLLRIKENSIVAKCDLYCRHCKIELPVVIINGEEYKKKTNTI